MNKNKRIEELEARIEELKEEKEIIERWGENIKQLSEFSDEDKIAVFDKLYKRAHQYLKDFADEGYEPRGAVHYMYEAVINNTLGQGAWGVINAMDT